MKKPAPRWRWYPHEIRQIVKGATSEERAEAAKLGLTLEQVVAAKQARALAAIEAVRPVTRRARTPITPLEGRRRYVLAGMAVIAEEDPTVLHFKLPGSKKWIVRVYYRSQGGEVLCFEVGPLRKQEADEVASEYGRGIFDTVDTEVIDVGDLGADAAAQDRVRQPLHGARVVQLPSQARPLERVVELAGDPEPLLGYAKSSEPVVGGDTDGVTWDGHW